MSQALVDAVWSSAAPDYLKRGILGALAAWARDDGTFQIAPTVEALTAHRYFGCRLTERAIQQQLRALERLGLISAPPHVGGRGVKRAYMLHPRAIVGLTVIAVEAEAAHRADCRKGATVAPFVSAGNGARKGATKGATESAKGCNKGCNGADPLFVRNKEKNVRTEKKEPRLPPSPAGKGATVAPFSDAERRLEAQGELLGLMRTVLAPAAQTEAQQRTKARRIAAVLRDLVTRHPRPAWLDYGDVREGLRRELKRLKLSYSQADFDDAISWLSTNKQLIERAPATAARHRGIQ